MHTYIHKYIIIIMHVYATVKLHAYSLRSTGKIFSMLLYSILTTGTGLIPTKIHINNL